MLIFTSIMTIVSSVLIPPWDSSGTDSVGEVRDNETRGYVSREALGYGVVMEDNQSDLLVKEKFR